jgi:cardiolipin synthase A/B
VAVQTNNLAVGASVPYAKSGVGAVASQYETNPIMLVDNEWAMVGSCNLHHFSLFENGEMNVAFSEPNTVRAFRCELFREHLGQDTSGMDDRNAFHLFRKIARENRKKSEAGDHAWQGLACELDLATYVG